MLHGVVYGGIVIGERLDDWRCIMIYRGLSYYHLLKDSGFNQKRGPRNRNFRTAKMGLTVHHELTARIGDDPIKLQEFLAGTERNMVEPAKIRGTVQSQRYITLYYTILYHIMLYYSILLFYLILYNIT